MICGWPIVAEITRPPHEVKTFFTMLSSNSEACWVETTENRPNLGTWMVAPPFNMLKCFCLGTFTPRLWPFILGLTHSAQKNWCSRLDLYPKKSQTEKIGFHTLVALLGSKYFFFSVWAYGGQIAGCYQLTSSPKKVRGSGNPAPGSRLCENEGLCPFGPTHFQTYFFSGWFHNFCSLKNQGFCILILTLAQLDLVFCKWICWIKSLKYECFGHRLPPLDAFGDLMFQLVGFQLRPPALICKVWALKASGLANTLVPSPFPQKILRFGPANDFPLPMRCAFQCEVNAPKADAHPQEAWRWVEVEASWSDFLTWRMKDQIKNNETAIKKMLGRRYHNPWTWASV